MGMVSGVVFLASSLIESRVERGRWSVFRGSHLVVVIMLVLTAISQFHLIPRMDSLRLAAGEINQLPPNDALRVQFDHLHTWSTRIEGAVLVLGLIVLYVTTRRLAAGRP
jgi:peptidoglycan/LPS O-acetylase OafA/YrhL